MNKVFNPNNSTLDPIRQESVLHIRLQHQKELLRLASRDVLSKKRKLEALKIENLRLKRLVKSQSEGVGA